MKILLLVFIILSVAGLIDTGYLFINRLKQKPLICPLDHDCSVVTESRWGKMLGVRNEVLGLLFYAFLLALALVVFFSPSLQPVLIKIMVLAAGVGLLFSVILTGISFFVIKDYCFYCLISAFVSLFLFINALIIIKI